MALGQIIKYWDTRSSVRTSVHNQRSAIRHALTVGILNDLTVGTHRGAFQQEVCDYGEPSFIYKATQPSHFSLLQYRTIHLDISMIKNFG